MSDVQVVEPVEVLVPLDREAAERLDKRLRLMAGTTRENFEKVGRLLDEAKRGQVHQVLGFDSWTAYVADAVGGQLQLSRDARQVMVALLSAEGMSTRAISSALGASQSTVQRDLVSGESFDSPDSNSGDTDSADDGVAGTTTGLDNKTYPKRKPRAKREPKPKPNPESQPEPAPEPEPVKAGRQVQIPTAYRDTVKGLRPLVEDLLALTRDPRWTKARGRFNYKDRDTLDRHITALQSFRDAMGEQ